MNTNIGSSEKSQKEKVTHKKLTTQPRVALPCHACSSQSMKQQATARWDKSPRRDPARPADTRGGLWTVPIRAKAVIPCRHCTLCPELARLTRHLAFSVTLLVYYTYLCALDTSHVVTQARAMLITISQGASREHIT